MTSIPITRSTARFLPDLHRVITKPFLSGEPGLPDGQARVGLIIRRILAMPPDEVSSTLTEIREQFADRHPDFPGVLERSYGLVARHIENADDLSMERRLLIGAYFTHEYSIEAAALSNPSMVPAPDQSGLRQGEQRFVMSMRAIGEGHISSIEFRTGVVGEGGEFTVDTPSRFPVTGDRTPPTYDMQLFTARLEELGAMNDVARMCLDSLGSHFSFEQLQDSIDDLDRRGIEKNVAIPTTRIIHWLASSNYDTAFPTDTEITDRVIFPAGPTESHGMEDARFVRFTHDNGRVVYYATYTAYDGVQILPQLIETSDFASFTIRTLGGSAARNKGIALFPRKVDGHYAALSRQDNENNYLMLSSNVRHWEETERIQIPEQPWELTQIGNSGSPLETEARWLVITHGVGPMRQYTLVAILLDIDDPCRVIGHLDEPLLAAGEDERDGYVPNVVYSCGSMIHGDLLVLPYGYSDRGAGIATVPLGDLLTVLTAQ
ncbi:MAG: glycoside hydrolase family 130 protein [Acidimicrobiia bacterium]